MRVTRSSRRITRGAYTLVIAYDAAEAVTWAALFHADGRNWGIPTTVVTPERVAAWIATTDPDSFDWGI